MKHLSKEVSFPLAKLLKEKGFGKCRSYWNYNGEVLFGYKPRTDAKNLTPAPTIAEVIDWFHEKHEILITATRDYDEGMFEGYEGSIDILSHGIVYTRTFDSLSKALEVAIEHALEELI